MVLLQYYLMSVIVFCRPLWLLLSVNIVYTRNLDCFCCYSFYGTCLQQMWNVSERITNEAYDIIYLCENLSII